MARSPIFTFTQARDDRSERRSFCIRSRLAHGYLLDPPLGPIPRLLKKLILPKSTSSNRSGQAPCTAAHSPVTGVLRDGVRSRGAVGVAQRRQVSAIQWRSHADLERAVADDIEQCDLYGGAERQHWGADGDRWRHSDAKGTRTANATLTRAAL